MNSLLPNVGYLRKHPYRTCTPSFRKYTHLTSKLQEHTRRTMTKEKSRGLTHGRVGPLLVISYELALLELRTSLLELLAMLVGGKLLEVLDKALS